MARFFKYHGAGNDFLIADNRDGKLSLKAADVQRLCNRHTGFGADGAMLLESSAGHDFRMVFFNPDGSGGMMCGNGGRCIVAFAADLGIVQAGKPIVFEAPDGLHEAEITVNEYPCKTVRLKMKNVSGIRVWPEEHSCFLDTGTRHLVKFVEGLQDCPVLSEGRRLRHDPRFAPVGTNVNFVEPEDRPGEGTVLHVRTFEKGVEDETLACGTGIVASALAAYSQGVMGCVEPGKTASCAVKAAIADLTVDFVPGIEDGNPCFRNVWLTGPADFVGTVEIML